MTVNNEPTDTKGLSADISKMYPVRYERRSAIAPVLWICGATFTTILIWCTINTFLASGNDKYIDFVVKLTVMVVFISFSTAIASVVVCMLRKKDYLHSEHYLLEMARLNLQKDSGGTEDKEKTTEKNDIENGEPKQD